MQPMPSIQGTISKELLNQSTLPSGPVRSVWGSGLSSKIRSQQPITQPIKPTIKDDGSMHAPMTLHLTNPSSKQSSNYTGVVSLLIVDASGDQILLMNDQSQSSDQSAIDWEWPSELIESGSTIQLTIIKALQSINLSIDQSTSLSNNVHLVCVEHYPTLASQWMRYSYIIKLDDDQSIKQSIDQSIEQSKVKFFSIRDLIDEKITINQPNLVTVLQEIVDQSNNQLDWSRFVPAVFDQSTAQTPFDSSHIKISVAMTLNDHLLVLTNNQSINQLPSSHCDKGETITFTVDRLARARFGLVNLTGQSIIHLHHSVKQSNNQSGEGVHFVFHADLSDSKLDLDLKNAPHTLSNNQSSILESMPDVLKPIKANQPFSFIPLNDPSFGPEMQPIITIIQSRLQSNNQTNNQSNNQSDNQAVSQSNDQSESSESESQATAKETTKPVIGVPVIHVKPQSN